jgi:peptidoglycan/xylan/chitin deacetylase (PgdA/CDA1 family)
VIPSWLAGQDVTRIPTTRHVVALTFDGGANADGLASILATLAAQHVVGTFFLTGNFVTNYPSQSKAIATAGHEIGNHTVTHPHSAQITDAELTQQVRQAQSLITSATGVDPRPWFRFPFGERTTSDIRLLNQLGYICVRWGVDTLGWKGTSSGQSVDSVVTRIVDNLKPGLIVLMHVGSHPTDHSTLDADALASVITELRTRGYGFVTVNALLVQP